MSPLQVIASDLYKMGNTSLGKVYETLISDTYTPPTCILSTVRGEREKREEKKEVEMKEEEKEENKKEECQQQEQEDILFWNSLRPSFHFPSSSPREGNAHDAGFDAYMTGVAFACMVSPLSSSLSSSLSSPSSFPSLTSLSNQINIFGCLERVMLGREEKEGEKGENVLVVYDFDSSLDNRAIQAIIKKVEEGKEGEEGKGEGERKGKGKRMPVKWKWIDDTSFFFFWLGEEEKGEGKEMKEWFWEKMGEVEGWKVRAVGGGGEEGGRRRGGEERRGIEEVVVWLGIVGVLLVEMTM